MFRGHQMMMCSVCTDKKRAKIKLYDAERIFQRVQQYVRRLETMGYKIEKIKPNRMNPYLFHEPIHVICGVCPTIESERNQLQLIERKLSDVTTKIYTLYQDIQGKDTKATGVIAEMAQLFRGYYPNVARMFIHR